MSFSLLLLAASLSIDSIGVAVSYSLKRIRIPWKARIVAALCSSAYAALAIFLGQWLARILPTQAAGWIGISFLAILGTVWTLQAVFYKEPEAEEGFAVKTKEKQTLYNFVFASLEITIRVLADPDHCDLNHSRHIDQSESFLLGFVLSVDAIAAGLSLSLSGGRVSWFPLLIGVCQILFLSVGVWLGEKGRCCFGGFKLTRFLPGAILLILCGLRIFI